MLAAVPVLRNRSKSASSSVRCSLIASAVPTFFVLSCSSSDFQTYVEEGRSPGIELKEGFHLFCTQNNWKGRFSLKLQYMYFGARTQLAGCLSHLCPC